MSAGDKTKGASSAAKPSATKAYAIKVAIKLALNLNFNYNCVYDIISYFKPLFLTPTLCYNCAIKSFIMLLNFLSQNLSCLNMKFL